MKKVFYILILETKVHLSGKYYTAADLISFPLSALEWLYNIVPIIERLFPPEENEEIVGDE